MEEKQLDEEEETMEEEEVAYLGAHKGLQLGNAHCYT